MNNKLKRIKNKIQIICGIKYKNKYKEYKGKKKIFYMLTPTHGNMGDQAIAYATQKYLEDYFYDYEIIEVYRDDTYKYLKAVKMAIEKDDIIVLHGGGNMGNLYPVEEQDRRIIIDTMQNNKIISMTQTMSFSNDEIGNSELNKSKCIYNVHKDLTLIARETVSYESMKKEFINAKILLNPDIVFYLNDMYSFNKDKRSRIMTCLRSDKESILGNDKEKFITLLNTNHKDVFNYDTVIDKYISSDIRENELKAMFNEFRASKVVITDRLHGMVFCVITKTPCIVTKSLDHKVIGTYQWIKELDYIRLVDKLDYEKINSLISELSSLDKVKEIDFKEKYFSTLSSELKEIIKLRLV